MFDSIVENKRKRRWVPWLLGGSLGLHAAAVLIVLFIDQLRVAPVSEPAVTITFVDLLSAPPPPPPPPPPKKRSEPKKQEVKPVQKVEAPKEFVAPKDIPQQKEEVKDAPQDTGTDDGVEGGVEGGVAGGVVGGAVGAPPPPPPPPPPAAPTFQEIEFVRKRRLTGSEPSYPSLALKNEVEGTVVAKLTIGPEGTITDIVIMQTHPAFERTVREALAGWKFSPHLVNGRPVSVYTIVKFTFQLQ